MHIPGKRIDDLPDHTVQGIWEAQQAGEIVIEGALDETIVRSAEVLAEKRLWRWMFSSSSEDASLWQDLYGNYWVVYLHQNDIREW